jgi:SAM-dependent methyltransferase
MKNISKKLKTYYRKKFIKFGPTSKGVDWGDKQWAADLRNFNMLKLIKDLFVEKVHVKKKMQGKRKDRQPISFLDIGCGYGHLLDLIKDKDLNIKYTGVDICSEMISYAKKKHPDNKFFCEDILDFKEKKYDYIVCNGILTQKLNVSTLSMNYYSKKIIKKMFKMCKKGIAFNLMSTHVNFQKENIYYCNPAEMLAWCMSEITSNVKLDASYKLWYEYTMYLYRENIY